MKIALLLPGYLDSPDYLHMLTLEKRLTELGYTVERIDPCQLWKSGETDKYTVTNTLQQIKDKVDQYKHLQPEEIILIGHSLGAFTSIIAAGLLPEITRIVCLCPPSSIENLGKKWEGRPSRISKRDLPEDSSQFREFEIPLSFVEDARKYSAIEAIKNFNIPIMIFIALADTVVNQAETEILISNAVKPYVIRQPNMGHIFRKSQAECDIVMGEIEKFIFISR